MSYKNEKGKLIKYNNYDPRYNLTIRDSDEFNTEIYPFQIKKDCDKACTLKYELDTIYPPITRCWSQAYEHCFDLESQYKNLCNGCTIDVSDSLPRPEIFKPKNLLQNDFF